jgi:hypothetical protein
MTSAHSKIALFIISEELQYNSDSGVDVNSVSSCDSAIHSPKMPYEFDLKEAVNFLVKGIPYTVCYIALKYFLNQLLLCCYSFLTVTSKHSSYPAGFSSFIY